MDERWQVERERFSGNITDLSAVSFYTDGSESSRQRRKDFCDVSWFIATPKVESTILARHHLACDKPQLYLFYKNKVLM